MVLKRITIVLAAVVTVAMVTVGASFLYAHPAFDLTCNLYDQRKPLVERVLYALHDEPYSTRITYSPVDNVLRMEVISMNPLPRAELDKGERIAKDIMGDGSVMIEETTGIETGQLAIPVYCPISR